MNILVEAATWILSVESRSLRAVCISQWGCGFRLCDQLSLDPFLGLTLPMDFFFVTVRPTGRYLESRPMRMCPSWRPEGGGDDRPPVTCLVVAIPEHGGIIRRRYIKVLFQRWSFKVNTFLYAHFFWIPYIICRHVLYFSALKIKINLNYT